MLSRTNLEFGRENIVMRKMHLWYNLKYKNGFESASENTGSGMTAYCCVLFFFSLPRSTQLLMCWIDKALEEKAGHREEA